MQEWNPTLGRNTTTEGSPFLFLSAYVSDAKLTLTLAVGCGRDQRGLAGTGEQREAADETAHGGLFCATSPPTKRSTEMSLRDSLSTTSCVTALCAATPATYGQSRFGRTLAAALPPPQPSTVARRTASTGIRCRVTTCGSGRMAGESAEPVRAGQESCRSVTKTRHALLVASPSASHSALSAAHVHAPIDSALGGPLSAPRPACAKKLGLI